MVRDKRTSLNGLAVARAQIRTGVPGDTRARLQTLEPMIRATLDLSRPTTICPAEIPKTVKHPTVPLVLKSQACRDTLRPRM